MARLTTHILDTASGRPAAGVRILLRRDNEQAMLADVVSNAEGRTDAPLLEGTQLTVGSYELLFNVGDYFRSRGETLSDPLFLDVIPVRFIISDVSNYHVPLLVSRYGFSVYRGS